MRRDRLDQTRIAPGRVTFPRKRLVPTFTSRGNHRNKHLPTGRGVRPSAPPTVRICRTESKLNLGNGARTLHGPGTLPVEAGGRSYGTVTPWSCTPDGFWVGSSSVCTFTPEDGIVSMTNGTFAGL
jgi:hypothetical protein